MIQKGDRINLKDGTLATVTRLGVPDFISDPFPVYYVSEKGAGWLMSDELEVSKQTILDAG